MLREEKMKFNCLKTENVSKFSDQRGMGGERAEKREGERVKYELKKNKSYSFY